MRERPILFSGPMVRALLAGTKTQTRRPLSPRSLAFLTTAAKAGECYELGANDPIHPNDMACYVQFCPYGQVGDRLWVRESWKYADWTEDGEPWIGYAAGGKDALCRAPHEWWDRLENIWVELSDPDNYDIDGKAADRHWRPSIHMPRWASRILLEITEVRVERLQDISEHDARAEGVTADQYRGLERAFARAYSELWEQINGAGSWAANPWVWAVSFKPVPSPAEEGR